MAKQFGGGPQESEGVTASGKLCKNCEKRQKQLIESLKNMSDKEIEGRTQDCIFTPCSECRQQFENQTSDRGASSKKRADES